MASDIDPCAEAAVRLNAEANHVSLGFIGADLIGEAVDADIVLACDAFYDRAFACALVPWFAKLAPHNPRRIPAVLSAG
ncbi:hypothetical protein ACC703_39650, partial [Rhizobium ruizarguesonis]